VSPNATSPDLDPRIARSQQRVRAAALDELAAAGYGSFSIESVARRSGVAKSTIYRHWSGKLALIADALETLNVQPGIGPADSSGDVREDVVRLITHLAEAFADSTISSCTPALIEAAEHHADVRVFHHGYAARRRGALVALLKRGRSSGQLAADLDPELAAIALAGAVIYRRVMTGEPFPPSEAERLVDTVLGSTRRSRAG
jgi:AcrR family transcriptional regulator